MWRWLATLWLGFVTIRYATTAFRTLEKPPNEGWDLTGLMVWLAFLLAVVLSAALFRPAIVRMFWWALIAAAAILDLILSHTAVPALIASIVVIVAAGLGEFALQRLKLEQTTLIERLVIAIPIGMGFLALLQLGLACLGFFNSYASWGLMLGLAFPAIWGLRGLLAMPVETDIGKNAVTLIPMGYIFLLNLSWATAPEIQFDALNYHLAVPALYLQHGALIDLPYFFHSYFAHLMDMLFGLGMALGGPAAPKFLVLALGVFAVAAVFTAGRKIFTGEVGVWASLIFYSTPLVIWSSGTTYVDLPETGFIVASVVAFIRWYETSDWAWFAASGWIAGVAAGTKPQAVTALAVFPMAAAWRLWHDGRSSRTQRLRTLAIYVALVLIVAAPWYAVTYVHTGNPLFPLLNGVFQSPQWPFENTLLDARDYGIGTSPGALLRLPFRLTFETTRFGTDVRGAVGLAFLLAFPLALVFLRDGRFLERCLLAALGLHLTVWAFTFQNSRYYLPALPFIAVMGCAVFLHRQSPLFRLNRILLLCGVVVQTPIASTLFWNIPERFPVGVALGAETAESFLARTIPGYGASRFLNARSLPEDKVLGTGFSGLRFYLKAPLYEKTEIDLDRSPYDLAGLEGADLAAALAREGFAYILTSPAELRNPAPWHRYVRPEFLTRFAVKVYSSSDAVVFVIRGYS